jgi:hypothetical protein
MVGSRVGCGTPVLAGFGLGRLIATTTSNASAANASAPTSSRERACALISPQSSQATIR